MLVVKIKNLFRKISALYWREGDVYVAQAIEVEVASQGLSKNEALSSLKEALELYFEDMNLISAFVNSNLFEDLLALNNDTYIESIRKARDEYKKDNFFTHDQAFDDI